MNQDVVKLSQISVTAPVDNVLQSSAMGFLQGLYPPVGSKAVQTLRNGNSVQPTMDGYQLIPVNTVATGASSEDSGWLQDATSCFNAKISSNNYFTSDEYNSRLKNTKDFYSSLVPVVNGTFDQKDVTFKNAYIVYDLINVAEIHNATIPASGTLTNDTLLQVRTLADAHEWGLAYNASDDMRAMAGMQFAGEVLDYMNKTVTSAGASKFGIQFGAYASMMSFFGLANLPKANPDFYGVADYASSLVFELFTTADVSSGFPATDDLQVRFLFHNGTASNTSEPVAYPLFGGSNDAISWTDFSNGLSKFAVRTTEQWCNKCGNSTGTCAQYSTGSSNNGNNAPATSNSNGGEHMSAAIGGVIGAMVTLAVILGTLSAIMLLGGFRFVSKKALAGRDTPVSEVTTKA
jgi:hypothetical protein